MQRRRRCRDGRKLRNGNPCSRRHRHQFLGHDIRDVFWGVSRLRPHHRENFGANEYGEIGAYVRTGAVLALLLSAPGILILTVCAEDFFRLSKVPETVLLAARDYVFILAWALPAALLVRVFYALTSSIRRPKPIIWVNACALTVKLPISFALMNGMWGLPELGLAGCAYGTIAMFLLMVVLSAAYLIFDAHYKPFAIAGRLRFSDWRRAGRVLALGIPIGVSQLLEIGSLTIMAFIVARLGAQSTAAHQILASLTGLMFMSPMALGVGAQTLIANSIGSGDKAAARDIAKVSIWLSVIWSAGACGALYVTQSLVLAAYTADPEVAAIALSLFPLFVFYLVFDAIQIVTASVLRGYEQTLLPSLVYLLSLWGIGVLGGYCLTHGRPPIAEWALLPSSGMGVQGVWLAGAVSLVVCALGLNMLLHLRWRSNYTAS